MYVISQINILTSPFVFLGLIGWNRSIFTWWKSGITCSRQFEWVFVPSIERFPTPRCILHWPEWNAAHGLAAGLERRLNVGNILIAIIVITYKVTTFTTSIFFWVWICGRVQEIVFFFGNGFFLQVFCWRLSEACKTRMSFTRRDLSIASNTFSPERLGIFELRNFNEIEVYRTSAPVVLTRFFFAPPPKKVDVFFRSFCWWMCRSHIGVTHRKFQKMIG